MEICRKNKSAQNEEFLLWLGNQQQTASAEAVMRIKWIYNEKKLHERDRRRFMRRSWHTLLHIKSVFATL